MFRCDLHLRQKFDIHIFQSYSNIYLFSLCITFIVFFFYN